jgi:hypothetical protein
MDNKEHVAAANALIQWFNSQEIGPSDAAPIMLKVLAKLLVGAVKGPCTRNVRNELDEAINRIMLQLVHDMNERIFATRK